MNCDFVSVDFQYDFANQSGLNFNKGKSVEFIKNTLFPFLEMNGIKVSEIISDYRLPRGKSRNQSCVPGTCGFDSLIPFQLRKGKQWIKCMHNPLWTRKNIGISESNLGDIYQDPIGFNNWISQQISHKKVILFGLTAECCVLQTASELYFRGYDVYVIYEATDPMNERLSHKDEIMYHSTLSLYAKTIHFNDLKEMMGGQ